MHRASTGDLEKPCALISREVSRKLEPPFDAVEVALFRLAFSAIDRVDPEVTDPDLHVLKRPMLSSRVQRDRH